MVRLFRGVLIAVAVALVAPASAWARDVTVVVALDGPGLAQAVSESRVLTAAAKARRLEVRSAGSRSYVDALRAEQAQFASDLRRALPRARVGWRYQIVLNGISVTLPAAAVPRLGRLPGVAAVYPSTSYRFRLDRSPGFIGAPSLWTDRLATRGDGMKIGIVDDGVDQTHPFFNPVGYGMPAGFPKGQTAFTTAKVIAARAFAPRGATWRNARLAFDDVHSMHGTHVAGIAAGNAGTPTTLGVIVSGVAPRAYIGNYKVLTVPTEEVGLNGNAPEIVRGIEAAVADGMDVINLSIGEPEIEPTRDVVARALDGAAAAGVVPVVSAGNDFATFTRGSVISPASARRAISVGATEDAGPMASFSSSGPTPLSLRMKPEVVAPGTAILSSAPGPGPTAWTLLSGTSMAAPHVAGGAALLRQRHRDWTPAQVKAALTATANPPRGVTPFRSGGGLVDLPDADAPLVLPDPPTVSLGIVRPGARLRASVRLADAGGGAGFWEVAIERPSQTTAAPAVIVPGTLTITLPTVNVEGEEAGWIALRRAGVVRRIPYWFAVARPRLPAPTVTLRRPGVYDGSTRGRPARVSRYRYPSTRELLAGPEQVVRVVLSRAAANVGVAVTSGSVEPRILLARDENRLAGVAALPGNTNPYDARFHDRTRTAGVALPAPRSYYVVFDSRRPTGSRFTYRLWVDDTQPPTARLISPNAARGLLLVRVRDAGAGVDPQSIVATVRGQRLSVQVQGGIARIDVSGLPTGRHPLQFRVSDYQETKNDENSRGILPNTRVVRATIRVP